MLILDNEGCLEYLLSLPISDRMDGWISQGGSLPSIKPLWKELSRETLLPDLLWSGVSSERQQKDSPV